MANVTTDITDSNGKIANATTDITDSNGRINNHLPKRIFRESAENKNLLAKAGSLYYGTGETETVTIKLADNSVLKYQIPITKAVEPPIGGIKNDAVYGIKFVYNTTNQTITSAKLVEVAAPSITFPVVGGSMHWASEISGDTEAWENHYYDGSNEYNVQTIAFTIFMHNTTTAYKGMYWFSENGTSYELYYMAGNSPDIESDELVAHYDNADETWNWTVSDYQTATLSFAAQAVSKGFYNYVSQYMVIA